MDFYWIVFLVFRLVFLLQSFSIHFPFWSFKIKNPNNECFTYINTVLPWWSIRTWLSWFSLLSLKIIMKKDKHPKCHRHQTHLTIYSKLTSGPSGPGGPLSPCRDKYATFTFLILEQISEQLVTFVHLSVSTFRDYFFYIMVTNIKKIKVSGDKECYKTTNSVCVIYQTHSQTSIS